MKEIFRSTSTAYTRQLTLDWFDERTRSVLASFKICGKSLMKMLNSKGLKAQPCLAPVSHLKTLFFGLQFLLRVNAFGPSMFKTSSFAKSPFAKQNHMLP